MNSIVKNVELSDANSKTLASLRQSWRDWPDFETVQGIISQTRELAEKNPDNFDVHLLLADLYDSTRKYDLCTQAAVKALELNPDSALAHVRLGICYFRIFLSYRFLLFLRIFFFFFFCVI
jgi:hypothetical protein